MKNKPTISEIATKLSVSKSTVSKVLNNKPGISQETKAKIMEYANIRGYRFPDINKTDISILLPEIHKNLCAGIQKKCKQLNLNARCGIYRNEEEFFLAIKSLKKTKPKISAIYPIYSEEAVLEMMNFSRTNLVWFVGDLIKLENTFYFGENPKTEAKKLSDCFFESGCKRPLFIHSKDSVENTMKTKIFADYLAEKGIYPISQIFCKKISPPILARTIEMKTKMDFDCVYFGDDLGDFAEKALLKLSIPDVKIFKYKRENFEISIEKMLNSAKEYIETKNFPKDKYNF